MFITVFQLISGKLHITEQGDFIRWLYTQVPNTLCTGFKALGEKPELASISF